MGNKETTVISYIHANGEDCNQEFCIPVVIAAYEPDENLLKFLKELKKRSIAPVILVNDGSGSEYDEIFKDAETLSDVVIAHDQNYGKGRALKTAFDYVLRNYPNLKGVVTADSDGQHTAICVNKIIDLLREKQNSLILGVRNFEIKNIPWKSRVGNKLTRGIFRYITGRKITDTQTGLRGIPASFLPLCLSFSGDHFEFEMQMLLEASQELTIEEMPIETIYDSVKNHKTHFNQLTDSIRIYRFLFCQFFKYTSSAFSSFVLDMSLFSLFLYFVFNRFDLSLGIILSTIFARILSIAYNYCLNYKFVFKSSSPVFNSLVKYLGLAFTQMALSAFCTTGLAILFSDYYVVLLKIVVDTTLFLINYYVQKKYVFMIKHSETAEEKI